jgi:hypothetical protein
MHVKVSGHGTALSGVSDKLWKWLFISFAYLLQYNECNMSDAFRDRHENKLNVRSQVAVDAQVAAIRVHV